MQTKHQVIKAICNSQGINPYNIFEVHTSQIGKDYSKNDVYYNINDEEIWAMNIRKFFLKGGIVAYKLLHNDTVINDLPTTVTIKQLKTFKELGITPKPYGTYKQCEGGGWYSTVTKYYIESFGEFIN